MTWPSTATVGRILVLFCFFIVFSVPLVSSVSGVAPFSRWAFGFRLRHRILLAVGVRFSYPALYLSVKSERSVQASASLCSSGVDGRSVRIYVFSSGDSIMGGASL